MNDTVDRKGSPEPPDLGRLRITRDDAPPRPYRGFPWYAVLLLLGLAAAAWLFREPLLGLASKVREPTVRLARAVRVMPGRAGEGDLSANGYIVANRQASVATVLSGRLVEVSAEEGDVVPAGAVMGRIQYDDLEAAAEAAAQRVRVAEAQVEEADRAIAQARAELPRLSAAYDALRLDQTQARRSVERLEREVVRNRPLREQRLIDEATWDRIEVEADAARRALEATGARAQAGQAAIEAWKARIAQLEAGRAVAATTVSAFQSEAEVSRITLEKTKIRAPFEGLVIRKDAELGEVIAPTGAGNSRGSVFTIVDPGSLEVQVELSEKRIQRVTEGDAATIFMDADPETGLAGRLRKIWPRADRSKGTIELRVTFDERPTAVRPEMAARVVFRGATDVVPIEAPVVTVPAAAVVPRADGYAVYVLEDGVARLRPVVLGPDRGDAKAIAEGLEGGEDVILDPGPNVRDGVRLGAEEKR